ncbi:MEDS domain-containing protein [Amycolatopsis coloradensis]|uniref:MEDS domain-containing protein n=1 Tax=Amycolatopsis coloradensis TaxID=76021 RepID=UPI003CC91B9B
MNPTTAAAGTDPFVHLALFYRGQDDYLTGTVPFIREGLDRDEPVAVSVPGPKALSRKSCSRSPHPGVAKATFGTSGVAKVPFATRSGCTTTCGTPPPTQLSTKASLREDGARSARFEWFHEGVVSDKEG